MREVANAKLEFKFDGPKRLVSGYGSVFEEIDSYGDVVARGAFAKSIKAKRPLMLESHRMDRPVGVWTECREDSRGLFVQGCLADNREGNDVFELLKMGAYDGLSIGFTIPAGGWEPSPAPAVRRLTAIDLWEISIVCFPALSSARLTEVRSSVWRQLGDLSIAQQLGLLAEKVELSNRRRRQAHQEADRVIVDVVGQYEAVLRTQFLTELLSQHRNLASGSLRASLIGDDPYPLAIAYLSGGECAARAVARQMFVPQ